MRRASILLFGFLAGCTSVSSNYTGDITRTETTRLYVCHGYNCNYKTRLDINQQDADQFAEIFAYAPTSPEEERKAVSAAVQYFERRSEQVIGITDQPKSTLAGTRERGQMDCIDESTNTRSLLLYLEKRGLLTHHNVQANVSRGFFLDGRYPHSTAVLRERGGEKWAVDSWYAPMGGAPDILPLREWLPRGFLSAGDLPV